MEQGKGSETGRTEELGRWVKEESNKERRSQGNIGGKKERKKGK